MRTASLIDSLPKGSTYFATLLGQIRRNHPRTTRRVVVAQSLHLMKSLILDGPQKGDTIRLHWTNVSVREESGVIILYDDMLAKRCSGGADFLKIDIIEECTDERG